MSDRTKLWSQTFGEVGATLKVLEEYEVTIQQFSLPRQSELMAFAAATAFHRLGLESTIISLMQELYRLYRPSDNLEIVILSRHFGIPQRNETWFKNQLGPVALSDLAKQVGFGVTQHLAELTVRHFLETVSMHTKFHELMQLSCREYSRLYCDGQSLQFLAPIYLYPEVSGLPQTSPLPETPFPKFYAKCPELLQLTLVR